MTTPTNPTTHSPWALNFVASLDIEATGLQTGRGTHNIWDAARGRYRLTPKELLDQAFSHLNITEISAAVGGNYFNYVIDDFFSNGGIKRSARHAVPANHITTTMMIDGKERIVKRFSTQIQSGEDQAKLFMDINKQTKKFSTAEQAKIMRHFGRKGVYRDIIEMYDDRGRPIQMEMGAAKLRGKDTASDIINTLHNLSSSFIPKHYGTPSTAVPLGQFLGGFSGGLSKKNPKLGINKIVNEILNTPANPVTGVKTIAAWNPAYDVDYLRYLVRRFGDPNLSQQFEAQLSSGAIEIFGQERAWTEMVYGLLRDKPGAMKRFGIFNNPVSVGITGKLPGASPATLDEFQHALSWKMSKMVGEHGYFNWWRPLRQIEIHHAQADRAQADSMMDMFNAIRDEAYSIARQKNAIQGLGNSFGEFVQGKDVLKDGNILREAILKVMGTDKRSILKGRSDAEKNYKLDMMLEAIMGDNEKIKRHNVKTRPEWLTERKDIGKALFSRVKNVRTMEDAALILTNKGFAAPLAVAGLSAFTLLSTYMYGNDNSKHNVFRKIKSKLLGESGDLRYAGRALSAAQEEMGEKKAPFFDSQFTSKILPGTTLALSAIYTAGLWAGMKRGGALGVIQPKSRDFYQDAVDTFKTLRYGMRTIEEELPLTRVFKFSSLLDYLAGSKYVGRISSRTTTRMSPSIRHPDFGGFPNQQENELINLVQGQLLERPIREWEHPSLKSVKGNQLRVDAFFPDHNIAVEFDGLQHEQYSPTFHKTYEAFKEGQMNDLLKDQGLEKLGIRVMRIKESRWKEMLPDQRKRYVINKMQHAMRKGKSSYVMDPALEKYRSIEFSTVAEGKTTQWDKETYIKSFMDAIEETDPRQHAELQRMIFRTQEEVKQQGINKSIVRISRMKNGGVIVFVDDINVVAGEQVLKKRNFQFNKVDVQFGERFRLSPSGDRIQNTFVSEYVTADAFRRSGGKKTFNRYMAEYQMPEYIKDSPMLSALWRGEKKARWLLDLDSKGINQVENKLYDVDDISRIRNVVMVRGVKKGSFWNKSNLLKKYDYYGKVPTEMISAMNRFLETPFDFIALKPTWMLETAAQLRASQNMFGTAAGKALGFLARPHLGLNVSTMRYGAAQYLAEFGLKRLLPGAAGLAALGAVNKALGIATFDPTGKGPLTSVPIRLFQGAALAYSKISDLTGMTYLAKRQERIAPGSTGLGIFAFPASLAGIGTAATLAYKHGPATFRSTIDGMYAALSGGPNVRYDGPMRAIVDTVRRSNAGRVFQRPSVGATAAQKFMHWAVRNPSKGLFAMGMIPMAPFLLGALGSNKSFAERRAEYKGERDVAIRKYRGWLMSPSPFTGGKVMQWRKHGLNVFQSDYENRGVIWPSYTQHMMHSVTGGLFQRYMLEKYHQGQPVVESAPYGSSVPFLGPIIASTIGPIIKPKKTFYEQGQGPGAYNVSALAAQSYNAAYSGGQYNAASDTASLISSGDISSRHGIKSQASTWVKQFGELAGFKGFATEAIMQYATGRRSPDQFTPYWQDGSSYYNSAYKMWQYQSGDVSVFGGEFLRRIYQNPEKKWEINNIPNEFFMVSWMPQTLQTGTTFDKQPMGWLYATKKGWEFQFPEVKGVDMERWSDPIRLEILSKMAPYSEEFNAASQRVLNQALQGSLSPRQEQKYYETLSQVGELKKALYSHAANASYALKMEHDKTTVTSFDEESMTFTVAGNNTRRFRLAGISATMEDIRANLLRTREYDNTEQLNADAEDIMARVSDTIRSRLSPGASISMSTAGEGMISGKDGVSEAIVGGLNKELLGMGLPLADTGNVSTFNMQQSANGLMSRPLARYWDLLNSGGTFWSKKLLGNRDYLNQYQINNVYNREVKLWNHPVEHFVKPFIASVLHHVGIDFTPSFTKRRRDLQEYWDVIKYIKYKKLEDEARAHGDSEEASHYEELWRQTMVGANPMDDSSRDELMALPQNERPYFDFFSNEPDPGRRAKIAKLIPGASRRIYEGIWAKKIAQTTGDEDDIAQAKALEEAEGWAMSKSDESDWTNSGVSKADYMRAKYVEQFAKNNALPGRSWAGWDEGIDIDNVELLSLQQKGEQVQDYGYFESHMRSAAFDKAAYVAAHSLHTTTLSSGDALGTVLPSFSDDDSLTGNYGMPTTSIMPNISRVINSNAHELGVAKSQSTFLPLLDDVFIMGSRMLRF